MSNLARLPMQVQKWIASLSHLFFLILGLTGISLMYINGNFGLGLTGIGSIPYEDTDTFNTQFNSDLNDIFLYMDYQDVFGADSSIDLSRRMLRMTYGPSETKNYSLSALISYLESMGYQLDDDFNCTKVSDPDDGVKSIEGYVDWTVQNPNRLYDYRSANRRRSTLENAALEIMDVLHRYYNVYNRFVVNPSNLHFKIQYTEPDSSPDETTVFSNTDSLTPENVKEYGRYAYLPGNSVFYDTNMKTIPLSSISALAANNPYTGSDYYLLVGIDTSYPVNDLYAQAHSAYMTRQHLYLTGFALTAFAALGLLLSFLFLFRVSGYQSFRSREVSLHGVDRTGTETGIVSFAVMTGISLLVGQLILVRILHLIIPSQYWYFSDQSLRALILYLGGLLLFFSLLRRYRAGTIWSSSLICRIQKRMIILKTKQNFRSRLGTGFLLYLVINVSLISLAWYFWDRVYLSLYLVYLLTGLTILVLALFNLWIFFLLFRQASEQEAIRDAVRQLSAGETSYQLDLDDFDGPELMLAEGLNNISSGLETALHEKMKSERLKTDLITNVSHDIKTPLTSIINYVNLMKREHIEDARINAYLDVLDQKSQRLKTLIEDLVEASKASSGNVKLEFTDIDLVQMAFQTNGEFEEKLDARHLQLILNAPREPLMIRADGRRLWRVLENLYNNVCKYAMEGSRVYVDLTRVPGNPETGAVDQAVFTIKNISASPLNIRADELTERFVRGDVARTTEGSGLGLSIAKDLTELQKGRFSLYIDGDLFKAQVAFDVVKTKRKMKRSRTKLAKNRPIKRLKRWQTSQAMKQLKRWQTNQTANQKAASRKPVKASLLRKKLLIWIMNLKPLQPIQYPGGIHKKNPFKIPGRAFYTLLSLWISSPDI